MLLTYQQDKMICDYCKGKLTEEERKMVEEWDRQCMEMTGRHLLRMPLTPEQEDLLKRCEECNLTADEKKQVLQLNQLSKDYCELDLLSPAMDDYCRSED